MGFFLTTRNRKLFRLLSAYADVRLLTHPTFRLVTLGTFLQRKANFCTTQLRQKRKNKKREGIPLPYEFLPLPNHKKTQLETGNEELETKNLWLKDHRFLTYLYTFNISKASFMSFSKSTVLASIEQLSTPATIRGFMKSP